MIFNISAVIVAIGLILVGNHLEGGHIDSLVQPTAALIVFGGAIGAVMLAATSGEFVDALKGLKLIFLSNVPKYDGLVAQLLELANVARKEGILALDARLNDVENPFLKNYLKKVVDGYDPDVLRTLMDDKIDHDEEYIGQVSKVYEDGGAFCPTVGILGAVLGLIHVMSNLSDPSKLGAGIAVAFVATIYGVGAANLFLIPMAKKYKKIGLAFSLENKLCMTTILGIQSGLNPRVIEDQLYNVLGEYGAAEEGDAAKKAA